MNKNGWYESLHNLNTCLFHIITFICLEFPFHFTHSPLYTRIYKSFLCHWLFKVSSILFSFFSRVPVLLQPAVHQHALSLSVQHPLIIENVSVRLQKVPLPANLRVILPVHPGMRLWQVHLHQKQNLALQQVMQRWHVLLAVWNQLTTIPSRDVRQSRLIHPHPLGLLVVQMVQIT